MVSNANINLQSQMIFVEWYAGSPTFIRLESDSFYINKQNCNSFFLGGFKIQFFFC